jgi:quinoprotein glucose dehydrogenase
MKRTAGVGVLLLLAWVVSAPEITAPVSAQSGAQNGEWRTYGGDLASTRYSPLDQINAGNFSKLEVAWRFRTDSLGPRQETNFQATPLMVGGKLYFTAGTRRAAVAVDAGTGELLWMHSIDEGERGATAPRQLSGRGLAYWSDGKDERILYVTPGYQLIALDARTGDRIPGFGRSGIVDLKQEIDQQLDPLAEIGLHAAPVVARDVVIVGAAHLAGGAPRRKTNVKGYVRGFDVRTGKRLWIFHTIPRPGELGNDTWLNDSWSYTGNAGVWAQMSVDEEAGLVYMPVELPTGDYYGGNRPGGNLFAESLVAVDLRTGQRKWHYQLVHHGIWDFDIPCAPILMDITVNGRAVKAIGQPTKQNWVYVFDRITGQPVWPIEERPVERGEVPGEWYSPTQPFVTRPPAFDRQGVTIDDLIDFTPELRAEAVKLVSRYKLGPMFTPPLVSTWEGPLATLTLPTATGGANWQGGSFDPETKMLYIFSNTSIGARGIVPADPARSDFGWVGGTAPNPALAQAGGRGGQGAPGAQGRGSAPGAVAGRGGQGGRGAAPAGAAGGGGAGGEEGGGGGGGGLNVQGLPLVKPPYGRITALDMNKGELVWQIAHGDTADNIKNHPALKGLNIPRTGRQGRIGVLTTRTLVIAGEGGMVTDASGRRGAMLRAYDKATGADAGAVYMPAPQTGSPMTYTLNGRQHIAVAISAGGYGAELLVFRAGS